jgi:hypothetical protein
MILWEYTHLLHFQFICRNFHWCLMNSLMLQLSFVSYGILNFILTCTFLFCGSRSVYLAVFVSRKLVFKKLLFKFLCVCLLLKKLINGKYFPVNKKYFPVKRKFGLIFRKVFSFYFERKTLSGSCEKFKNIILFADYI